ncbi:POTRA domain-containing protein [Proteus vulgaris]
MSPYLQKCLTLNDMHGIAKSITNNYIFEKGYVTSQAIIPEQDLLIIS